MEKGDIVYLEYDAWIKESSKLVETTDVQKAKENNIYNEKLKYGPVAIVVGIGNVIKGLDNSLLKAEIEKGYEVEIPPLEAYGERDPKIVEIFSIHEFRRQKIVPEVGMEVNIKNRLGTITAVTAGRVRVDFNHKLAGKTIRYKYRITKKASSSEEKVRAVIDTYYGNVDIFEIKIEAQDAIIKLPDSCKYDPKWFAVKYRIVSDLREYAKLEKIKFFEEYVKTEKEEKKEEKKTE